MIFPNIPNNSRGYFHLKILTITVSAKFAFLCKVEYSQIPEIKTWKDLKIAYYPIYHSGHYKTPRGEITKKKLKTWTVDEKLEPW